MAIYRLIPDAGLVDVDIAANQHLINGGLIEGQASSGAINVSVGVASLTITTYPASIDLSGVEGTTVALTLTTYPATVLPVQDVSGTGNQVRGLSLGLGLGL